MSKRQDIKKELALQLDIYLSYCDESIDFNYNPPKHLGYLRAGEIYVTEGDVRKIRPNEKPTLRGFNKYLKAKL